MFTVTLFNSFNMITFSNAVREGLDNFFYASGRMSRSAFLWFVLVFIFVSGAFILLIAMAVGLTDDTVGYLNLLINFPFLYFIFIPGIRRLHDVDKSGTNSRWVLVPIIGWVYLIYLYCLNSDPNENYFGRPTLNR